MILQDDIAEPTSLKDQYFDLRGLSVYSALGVGTLRNYLKSGGLPFFKLRGKILIKRSEFDAWLEGYRVNRKQDLNNVVDEILTSLKGS
jgi:excisionase family DNA binding protein